MCIELLLALRLAQPRKVVQLLADRQLLVAWAELQPQVRHRIAPGGENGSAVKK